MERLSEHDRNVLNVIFDPLRSLGFEGAPLDDRSDLVTENESEKLDADLLDIVERAISRAESEDFDESFRLFQKALDKAPESPSILNDRAQALRLAARDEEALRDLNLAVKMTKGKGKVGMQALCQRGALHRSKNEDDKAREDFALAARGGSAFAKSQLIALNPYAAMCNAMLREITLKSSHRVDTR